MAQVSRLLAALGLLGAVLAAAYGIPAFQAVFWAPEGPGSVSAEVADLDMRERTILWTLVLLILWLGLYPRPMLDLMEPAVAALVQR